MRKMGIAVFSYNRGEYLRQSVDSALRLTDNEVPVAVFDDGSSDVATLSVLNRARSIERVQVFGASPVVNPGTSLPRGGLYRNMDSAIRWAQDSEMEIVLFLQDDLQLVRQITERDRSNFAEYFSANDDSAQLHLLFSPFNNPDPPGLWSLDDSKVALLPRPGGRAFSDVGLFSVQRVVSRFGAFESSEHANNLKAQEVGLSRGVYRWPVGMFMPFPKTSSNRQMRSLSRLPFIEWLAGSGVHPYSDMDAQRVRELFDTDTLSTLPARQWLDCPSMNRRRFWSYYGGSRDLRAVGGVRGMIGAALGGWLQLEREPT